MPKSRLIVMISDFPSLYNIKFDSFGCVKLPTKNTHRMQYLLMQRSMNKYIRFLCIPKSAAGYMPNYPHRFKLQKQQAETVNFFLLLCKITKPFFCANFLNPKTAKTVWPTWRSELQKTKKSVNLNTSRAEIWLVNLRSELSGSRDFGLKIDFKHLTVKPIKNFCVSVKFNGEFFRGVGADPKIRGGTTWSIQTSMI